MQVKVEYRKEIHLINLLHLTQLPQLAAIVRATFDTLPPQFNFSVGAPDGPLLTQTAFTFLRVPSDHNPKLFVQAEEGESGLMEIKSESSFVRLEEERSFELGSVNLDEGLSQIMKNRDSSMFIMQVPISQSDSKEMEYQNSLELGPKLGSSVERHSHHFKLIEEEASEISAVGHQMEELSLNQSQEDRQEAVIFDNIQCDICHAFPIKGPVFKCLVCPHFDLCRDCEASYHHFHPSLRMTRPSHYPTSLRVLFPSHAQRHMKQQLETEKEEIKKQRQFLLRPPSETGPVEIDPSALRSRVDKAPNFLASVLGRNY